MPLDPQAQALIQQRIAEGAPPNYVLSPVEARRAFQERSAMASGPPTPMAAVEDVRIPGPEGELSVRIYTPDGTGPFPILVFFHGGGWVIGNLDTHDPLCRALAQAASCLVVSVGYRLAPEHKFPAAIEDCYAATKWAANNAATVNGDATRIAVGGDSSGGNLAAVVALMARDRGGPTLVQQLLIYPIADYSFDTTSYAQNASGYLLDRADMEWYWDHYLRNPADGQHPYASPLRTEELEGLPPALIITAEFDPLRDEGEAYAVRLREAGVRVSATRYDGMIHSFVFLFKSMDHGKRAIQQAANALRESFAV